MEKDFNFNAYDYSKKYSEKGLDDKIKTNPKKIGRALLRNVLILYYLLKSDKVPARAKATVLGALGYFIFPIDVIPDFIPVAGYSDDSAVIAAALITLACYIYEEIERQADETLAQLLE